MVPCIFFCLPHKTRSVLRLRRLKSQGRDSTSELLMWLHMGPCWGWGWEAVSWASLSQPSSESPLLLQALLMDSSYSSTPNLSLGWGRPQWVWRWLSPVSPLLLLDHPPTEASVLQRPNMYWASALPDHIHLQISGFLLFVQSEDFWVFNSLTSGSILIAAIFLRGNSSNCFASSDFHCYSTSNTRYQHYCLVLGPLWTNPLQNFKHPPLWPKPPTFPTLLGRMSTITIISQRPLARQIYSLPILQPSLSPASIPTVRRQCWWSKPLMLPTLSCPASSTYNLNSQTVFSHPHVGF